MAEEPATLYPDLHGVERLTAEQVAILRDKSTEAPFTGKYYEHKEKGTYHCAYCGAPLFSSEDKFASSTGWPSFTRKVGMVSEVEDTSYGMQRVEVLCSTCDSHLGHVFHSGKDHRRYCINSGSLQFEGEAAGAAAAAGTAAAAEDAEKATPPPPPPKDDL